MLLDLDTVYNIDCREGMELIEDGAIDLVVTSPPYPGKRGGVKPDAYVDWWLPLSSGIYRVLKDGGTFILNIKEPAIHGERHTCVLELILAMRKQGWLWTEEYIWHKKNSYPGKWKNRFRDGWERLLQFNKCKNFKMYQDAVMMIPRESTRKRLTKLSANDITRHESNTGSGLGRNILQCVTRDTVYPDNVLYLATECGNQSHSAAFPTTLPLWFIKLFSKEGDVVLDPFMGSGTVAVACERTRRRWLGFDIVSDYCVMAEARAAAAAEAAAEAAADAAVSEDSAERKDDHGRR